VFFIRVDPHHPSLKFAYLPISSIPVDPLIKGTIIGFSIAAPVGPVGLLCIRRSLEGGRLAGFVSGLGAATADTFYGLIAAFSLTALTDLLIAHRTTLQIVGGLFLLYLGIHTLRSHPPSAVAGARARPAPSLTAAYFSTLVLTATSPVTILAFLGIFAGLGVGGSAGNAFGAFRLVLGVFLGSAIWWLVLSSSAQWLGRKLQHGGLRALNIGAGLVITTFGLWQLAQLAFNSRS
jgi:threonine/homoserine/homoserine lactone efflux protein